MLVSRGYGAGWSTWNDAEHKKLLLMDKGLVELKISGAKLEDVESYVKSKLQLKDEDYICMAGWQDVVVDFVDEGQLFFIDEYDGAEHLVLISDISITA